MSVSILLQNKVLVMKCYFKNFMYKTVYIRINNSGSTGRPSSPVFLSFSMLSPEACSSSGHEGAGLS